MTFGRITGHALQERWRSDWEREGPLEQKLKIEEGEWRHTINTVETDVIKREGRSGLCDPGEQNGTVVNGIRARKSKQRLHLFDEGYAGASRRNQRTFAVVLGGGENTGKGLSGSERVSRGPSRGKNSEW